MERFYDFEIHVKGVDYPMMLFKKKDEMADKIFDIAITNYIKNNPEKTEKDFLKAFKKELKNHKTYKYQHYIYLAGFDAGFFDLEFDDGVI